ncbi:MAG: DNA-binding protein [Candidatus Electrothrix sp. YB6]
MQGRFCSGGGGEVAGKAGQNRKSLFKALAGEGNPRFSTVSRGIKALGCADGLLREDEKQRSRMLFLQQFQFRDQSSPISLIPVTPIPLKIHRSNLHNSLDYVLPA